MFSIGQQVKWLYTPRGGWNESWYVKGTVIKVTPKRVQVEAVNLRGQVVKRWCKPENVKEE